MARQARGPSAAASQTRVPSAAARVHSSVGGGGGGYKNFQNRKNISKSTIPAISNNKKLYNCSKLILIQLSFKFLTILLCFEISN